MTTHTKTFTRKVAIINQTDWNAAFWFAVLSPVLGIVAGFLALLFFYH